MGTREAIHLAIAFDNNYLHAVYTFLTSVFFNNKDQKIHFHAIAPDISNHQKKQLSAFILERESDIIFYTINQDQLKGLILPRAVKYNTIATYYRLFFPALVDSNIQKLLYIDIDTIVIGDLRSLYSHNMLSLPAAAVPEVNATKSRPDLGIDEIGTYFNAGVLLINVPEWNRRKISENAIAFVLRYPEKVTWADQDALNVVLKGNYKPLDNKYNIGYHDVPKNLTYFTASKFLKDKVIIHYTLSKPWNTNCTNRLRFLYYYYERRLPTHFRSRNFDLQPTFRGFYHFAKDNLKVKMYQMLALISIF